MFGRALCWRIVPKPGQLLFPSTSRVDKNQLRERMGNKATKQTKQTIKIERKSREREREGGLALYFTNSIFLWTHSKDTQNKAMTTKAASCIVANAAMEKSFKTRPLLLFQSLCNKTSHHMKPFGVLDSLWWSRRSSQPIKETSAGTLLGFLSSEEFQFRLNLVSYFSEELVTFSGNSLPLCHYFVSSVLMCSWKLVQNPSCSFVVMLLKR